MRVEVKEWIQKAEGDYHSAQREYRARKNPNYDAACFHAQQCVEKYLKAVLIKDRCWIFKNTRSFSINSIVSATSSVLGILER